MKLPENPKCTQCGEPVNHITRCERNYHSNHHSHCCPNPPKQDETE